MERRIVFAACRRRRLPPPHGRRASGNGARACGTGSRFAAAASSALMIPRAATRSSTRSRAARAASAEAVGPARLRRLRQRDQQRRLAERELLRLLAEIGERGGAHAFEIAAERREREIAVEHARLADRALDCERARDLPQLGGERALGARLDEARDLHRQGRAAGDDMAVHQPLSGRRAGARARRRRDVRRSARPRRRRASRHSADRRHASSPAGASVRRAR